MFVLNHYAISVSNIDKSIDFYKLLGFSVTKKQVNESNKACIVHMNNSGFTLELFCYSDCTPIPDFSKKIETDLHVAGSKHIGLSSENLDQSAKYLIENNIISEYPEIMEGKLGKRYFFISDPDGILIEIIEN